MNFFDALCDKEAETATLWVSDMDRDDAILKYLHDRMSADDRDGFEAEMTRDPSLASEVEVMRAARTALASGTVHDERDAVWSRLSESIDQEPRAANANRSPWGAVLRYAAVAVIAVSTWQLGIVPRFGNGPGDFRPASVQPAEFVLQVRFTETANLSEVGALLYALEGTISDGPGALGLLHVSFADNETRAQAIEALESSDLVEFVQTR